MSAISKGAATIFDCFKSEGAEIYLVGGTVRNHLWQLPIADRDFAVSCAPEESLRICKKHGLKTILTGFDHGTITIIAKGETFETTSFRKDVETDGRHAVTHFGGTLEEDALRRDFTINALYLDHAGKLVDPLNAQGDAQARILRFVGDAKTRIHEDYLRILRFFRFYSQYDLHPDHEGLKAISQGNHGLDHISAERIGAEMRKLLGGKNFAQALKIMADAGTTSQLGLAFDLDGAERLSEFEANHKITPNWMARLSAISATLPSEAWRLSKAEIAHLTTIKEARESTHSPAILGYLYGEKIAQEAYELRAFEGDNLPSDYKEKCAFGAAQTFPISGKDLLPYMPAGKAMGALLKTLERKWYHNNFALDNDTLLAIAIENINSSES